MMNEREAVGEADLIYMPDRYDTVKLFKLFQNYFMPKLSP